MLNFNELRPDQTERLAMLAEECAEIIQVIGKILRHGYDSYHPDSPNVTNRDLLNREIVDVLSVIDRVELLDLPERESTIEEAWEKKLRYSHHQGAA